MSISDTLKSLGIKNIAAKFDKKRITEISPPFIVQIKTSEYPQGTFSIVSECNKNRIKYYRVQNRKWQTAETKHFVDQWNGITLLANVEDDFKKNGFEDQSLKGDKHSLFVSFGLVLFLIIFLFQGLIGFYKLGINMILPFLFSLFILTAWFICMTMLAYDLNQDSSIVHQFCSLGKRVNCGAVLKSNGSRIFGISWSIIGFSYYSGIFLYLIILGIYDLRLYGVLFWISILTVPFVFYSIYYQWRKAKQWCTLCVAIQAIIVICLIISLLGQWYNIRNFDMPLMMAIVTTFILSFIVTMLVISYLRKVSKYRQKNVELQRQKYNPELFNFVLQQEKLLIEEPERIGIFLGNPKAKNRLIKVCNPYCGPCNLVHRYIEELLNYDLCIQIIFTASNSNDDKRALPVRHFLAIYDRGDAVLLKTALHDWYTDNTKNYDLFAERYPLDEENTSLNNKIEAMRAWCVKSKISSTPTFFLNGRQLPNTYSIAELKYLISE